MIITGKAAASAAILTMLVTQPAQACWSDTEAKAASVANLNMMMMVNALRCRNGKHNFLAEYNRFVKLNNSTLGAQNAVVRAQFAKQVGPKGAEGAMDRFTIGLANKYGTGVAGMDCAELKHVASELASRSRDGSALTELADRHAGTPNLPGGSCSMRIASRK